MKRALLYLVAAGLVSLQARAQEDLKVLELWRFHGADPHLVYNGLMQTASGQLGKRQADIRRIRGKEGWSLRQKQVSALLREMAGAFPEKTPLNPVITGTLERDGIRVEKLFFESRPGYFVTAALFMPVNFTGKLPAIVYCSGHSVNGFRSDTYQNIILNYVKKGFAVLAFDPIGQGERIQYLQAGGKSRFGPTHEHSYPGSLSFVNGLSPAHYFIWDGIRAVDYLVGRKEIDPARIGIAGRSGGGTQSAYIAAMDDRILAAAPECYLTSFDKLLRSLGPQDAEQLFIHAIARGFDLADLVEVRAPKPTLMVTTTRDMFSIEGAREIYREALAAYQALGRPDHLQMVEDDAVHASTKKNREAAYAFFRKFLGNPGNTGEEEVKLFTEQELNVFPEGNLYSNREGKRLFDLVREQAETVVKGRKTQASPAVLREELRGISGYRDPGKPAEVIFSGRLNREAYDIEKYLVRGAPGFYQPLLWLKPRGDNPGGAVLLLDEKGKKEGAAPGGLADRLALEGYQVILPDLSGIGELANTGLPGGDAHIEGVKLNLWYMSILTGKSLLATRMEEIVLLADFVKDRLPGRKPLSLVATGTLGADALQAMTVRESLFHKKVLLHPLVSFESLVTNPDYRPRYLPSATPGVLGRYDLPQLAGAQAPGTLLVISPVSGDGKPLDPGSAGKAYPSSVTVQHSTVEEAAALSSRITGFLR